MNWTELPCEQPHWNACVQNWLSTNRPSFTAANQVLTLTHMTNERVVWLGWLVTGQFSSVQFVHDDHHCLILCRWQRRFMQLAYILHSLSSSPFHGLPAHQSVGYTSVDSIDLCYWAILQLFSHPVFSAHASICEAACRSCISGGFLSLCISFSCSRLRFFSGKAVVININRALNTNRHPG